MNPVKSNVPVVGPRRPAAIVRSRIRAAIAVGAAITVFLILARLPVSDLLALLVTWIAEHPGQAYFVYFVSYVAATVLAIPAVLLTLAGGLLFGVWKGTALVSLSSVAGATAAFVVGRTFARNWVSRVIAGQPRFAALDRAIRRRGFWIVFLTRLSPAFPFNMLNYLYGVTGVPLRSYVLGTWLGMVPGTFLYVYLGSVAGSFSQLAGGQTPRSPATYVLLGVGLLATLAVTILVTRLASRELKKELE